MELQRIIVLFCTLAAGVSRPTLEDLKHKDSCASQCAGYSAPNLPMGSRLSYRYSTSTNTFLQGSTYQRSGISLESTAVVEALAKCHRALKLQDVQIKMTSESREKLITENGHLRAVLERHPLWFCFHNGTILKIFPKETEPTWVLNIKRGILSALQTSWVAAENSTVDEVDVLGKCPTKYQRKGSLLLKTKDLNLCSQRFSAFTSLRSVALPSAPSQQQFLSSRLECVQRFEGGILAEVKCTDSNRVTLSARKGGGAKTQTRTAVKLFRVETDIALEKVDTKAIYESSLLYEREKTARWPRGEEVADILQKLCMRLGVNPETTDLFMTFVFELQHLSADDIMSLWQRPPVKCRDNGYPLADALPSCATEACITVMKELIVSEEVDEARIESFLWSLSFVPEPTAGMIAVLTPLLQLPRRRQSAFLGLTSLVHHFCSTRKDCDQNPEVLGIMRILGGHLGRKCAFHKLEGIDQVELVLKSIGNAGLGAMVLTPVLSSCAAMKSNPLEIRLAAIEAFRRIPCVANRTMLLQLYQTYNEDVEIRIASYLMSMKCPSEELFHQIKQTLQEEKSSQVGSFVWSHLTQLLETDDPVKQHLKYALPDDILSKEFDGETWKFSSYSDITFHSALANGNMETKLIFSPASFIPRVIATNLTVHVLGRAINILELGVRLENLEDVLQKVFGLHPLRNTKTRHTKPESPIESAHMTQQNNSMSKKHSLRNYLPSKDSKSKLRKEKQSCPSGQYNKMSALVKKLQFTKRMGKKKKPKCSLSIKVFGNELAVLDCGDLRSRAKRYYLNLAELVIKLLKGQEVQFNKRLSLAREELVAPALSGLPILLALNSSATINVTFRGNVDFKQWNNFFINGYIKPSVRLQVSAQMGMVGTLGKTGLNWATGLRSSTSLDGGIQVKKGKELKVFLNTPEDSLEILHFSSQLYVTGDERQTVENLPGHNETKSCTNEEVSKTLGWQLCSEISTLNEETSSFLFPFPGPVKVAVTLKKQDTSLNQYLMKAAYNYISQKGSRIPNEAGFHFFLGTPKSELKRDVAIDLYFNLPEKKFRIEFIHPKKKVQMSGKFEASRNARMGHLELILDDSNVYFIKGKTDLQTVGGEQRYVAQLEAKLLKHGSPIVLSGNVTKQPGKKMALSVALVNLLKDAAFLSGDAKNLQHECNMVQKLKVESSPPAAYNIDLEHEMFCTQILAYNHKVHLHHAETASQLHSKLEVSYGKHWDEINKRRVLISQTLKNNSSPNFTSYLMEFTVQVPEKQVDCRTRLQHSHSTQSSIESSTNFKVQYNNRMPFVADLQWRDSSRHSLKKWEGMFNMDTPWLYLYAAHKLHQPQRSAYFASTEFTAGKAFVVKGLVVEIFCKDKGNEKEGRVWIYTPSTTYLQASTVNRLEKDSLHSQSEIVSLWNQLVKNELRVENREQAKSLRFMMKCAKQELNLTAAYFHLEAPKKTNVSIRVWWADHKNVPIALELEAQIEEMKKENMLYQKRGTIQFRHPFKLYIPQSFLLQETFTVNKREKRYILETRVLINGLKESVQTLTLGYQAENSYICAGLVHPYNSEIFPQNLDICAVSRNLSSAKCEVEAILKLNKEKVFHFLGKYQNRSNVAHSQHLVQMDMTHSFQLKFPQSVAMNGELISKESQLADFDWRLTANSTINRQDTSEFKAQLNGSDSHLGISSCLSHLNGSSFLPIFQAHATTSRHGRNSLNGSFYLHSSGKDLVLLEASLDSEMRKSIRAIGVSAVLKQAVLRRFRSVWLKLAGKVSPSRVMLSSVTKLDQNIFHLDIIGSKEEKAGLALTLDSSIRHNVDGLKHLVPLDFSLDGSLKLKSNAYEGALSVRVNQFMYRLHIENNKLLGDTSFQNITVAVTQNGSHTFPSEAQFRGQLELSGGVQKGSASFQVDTTALCIDISSIAIQEQMEVTGTFTHNMSTLYAAGFPTKSGITAMYGQDTNNCTVTLKLQGGDQRMTAAFEVETQCTEALRSRLAARFSHNIAELEKRGVPSIVEGACRYQNFSNQISMGATAQLGEEQLRVQLESQGTNSTAGFALFLHHDVKLFLHIIPPVVKLKCDGESTSHQLSGHCSGEVAGHAFEVQGSFSELRQQQCALLRLSYRKESLSIGGCFRHRGRYELTGLFTHTFKYLCSLNIPWGFQVRVLINPQANKPLSLLNLTTDGREINSEGEARASSVFKWYGFASVVNLEGPTSKHVTEIRGSYDPGECRFEADVRSSSNREVGLFKMRSVCKGSYVLEVDLCQKTRSQSKNKVWRFSLVMTNDFLKGHLIGKLEMERGPKHIKMSGRILLLANHSEVHWMWLHHWGNWERGGLSVLEDVQSTGLLKWVAFSVRAQMNCTVSGKPLEVEMETAWGQTLELHWLLSHSVPAWTNAGFPARNWLHGVARLGSRLDLSLEVMSGPCRITSMGRFGLYPEWTIALHSHCPRVQIPVRVSLSGCALPGNSTANFAGEVVLSDEAFTRILFHAAWSSEHSVEISIQNTWAYLSALGLAKENRITIAAAKANEYKGLLEVTVGECVLSGDGELNTAGDVTTAEWRVRLLQKCDALEKMTLPKNLVSRGLFLISPHNISLTVSLQCDGRTADMQLEASLAGASNMQGIQSHALPPLHHQRLPPESSVLLSVMNGSNLVGHLLLHVDNCRLKADGELRAKNRTEWTLEWETDCKLLQDLGAPSHSQLTGSIWKDGCQVECLTTFRSGSKEALLEVRTKCQPKVTFEAELRHDLPFLRRVPDENKLFVDCGEQIGQVVRLDLKAGPCELRAGLDLHAANRYQWQLSVENNCKAIQDLGVPIKAEGLGHIVIGKTNLDSEVLVTAGENTLHGLLTLNITNARQDLHALLMHNLEGTLRLGIPARTVADLILEKKSAIWKRFLQFTVDSKQITEELSYSQKPNHVALKYKLRHNLEPLQAWWIEDEVELQAAAVLKDVKNVMVKVHYGSCWVTVGGQIQKTSGSLDLRGNLQHKWPRLLQADIPEATQMLMSFKINTPQEKMRTVAGQTLIMYSANSIHVVDPSDICCCSQHSDVALVTSSCSKAVNLTFMLQKLENKARLAFQGECNNKTVAVVLDVFSGVEPHGPFELTVEVKHSLGLLEHLRIPFSLKLTLFELLSANKTEGTLKLACDSDLSFLFVFSAQNEWQSEEFKIKSLQNLPFLLQYLPSMAEFSSKVNYSTKEVEEKLSIHMENKESLIVTKVTSAGPNHTQVLQLTHTIPQLTILPRQLVLTTAYQKSTRTQALRWTALWDGEEEANFTGSYTGLFPKVSGGHDLRVEICHPLSIPFPKHSMLKVYTEHSLRSHKDEVVVGWDSKEQISVSSSLKFGREHINYQATIAHPFNITVNQIEVNALTESRRGMHSQQMQLTWNDGQPAHLNCTFRDKSKANGIFWDACVAASSSQLRNILPVGSLQACGLIEQTTALFNQQLDVKWDGKKVKQNLTFEKKRPLHLDKIHLDAILENIFFTSCSSQRILGDVETDYSAWLNYHANLRVCDFPNEIAIFGKHQLNKGDLLLQSEGKVSLAGDEGSITVALRNHSNAKEKKYSVEFALKASEAVWLDVTGSLTSSAGQSQVVVEGNIDPKEKVKLAASSDKECLRYYMGYSKGRSEDGLEFAACTDGRQQATLNAHLIVNGTMPEEVGRLALKATNQSLSLEACGCGDPVLKIESKLTEIVLALQHSLLMKLKNLEERFQDFRKSVQRIDFLYDAAGWPVNVLQEVAGLLQNGARRVTQIWKQNGVKQALQHSLPLYLGKIQSVIRQMQNELRRPLTTLKDAYYDASLKPLDEVWQQKTEEYLKRLQAFVPTIVKDAWLMEPIQVSLRMLKTGLDMVTQQMLSWAEDKLSRAVSRIQKPLSNLYSFSARNCSVALRLPVVSNGEPTLDLANVINYLIEEKLMKPFRGLYHINPAAEYYRFKQTMMESPFEHHALLMGGKHLRTFDGNIYSLSSICSVLLATDVVHDAFTVILNQDRNGLRLLHINMNGTTVMLYPEQKIYKKSNISQMENCQNLDTPLEGSGVTVRRGLDDIEVASANGIRLSCDLRYDLCTLTLDGWHHGISAGLFGTNDNEGGNEWMLPDHSYAGSLHEFMHGWQVSNQCPPMKKTDKSCPGRTSTLICKSFFQDSSSFFRNCFSVVNPEPFYNLCAIDMCELHNIKSACALAAAFVHLCNRNFVPLEMPLQCDQELRLRDST